MADTSLFSIGCMKWQHAVTLEPIWETESIIILFPALLTGLLTPLLTCFTLLSFALFTWTNFFKSNSLSPFCFFGQKFSKSNSSSHFSSDKNILSSTSILQKYSKFNFNSAKIFLDNFKFCLSRKINSISQNYSKSHFFSDWKKIPLSAYKFILLPPESKRCPLALASAFACADSVVELRLWNKSES